MLGRTSSYLWILFGPVSLLAALSLLIYRAGAFMGRPVWLFGLTMSIFFACGIVYLTFKELLAREKGLLRQTIQKKTETESIKATLEETHFLYREKIKKLEQTIAIIEEEQKMHLADREEILKGLKEVSEKAVEESKAHKNQSLALQTSLEDALDELREIRQFQYIQQELGKTMPKDLPSRYKQLREQFDEKALILDQTRRRLFVIEGQCIALKKQQDLNMLDEWIEEESLFQMLQNLLEENLCLEEEIVLLETLVSQSLRSAQRKKTPKKVEQILEFQFSDS